MEERNRAFQLLKPPCVQLSESALKLMGKHGNVKQVVQNLEEVRKTLDAISRQKDVLNDKLAEYAFFPISHVLKQLEKLPVRARELTLECLSILLRTAWKSHIVPELGMQLLILFSFIADLKGAKTSEELQVLVFSCMSAVFQSLAQQEPGREALIRTASIPHLGKCVSVILDGILDGSSDVIQLAAVAALQSFCLSLSDDDALAISFLPGIMSCLTKVLTPKSSRVSSKVLTASLEVLLYLIPRLFCDDLARRLPEVPSSNVTSGTTHQLDKTWLRATAPQIKMSFANIIKLRQHDRENVRHAMAKLCMLVLQQCRESLSDSTSMLLETTVTLTDQDHFVERQLKLLLTTEPELSENLRSSLHHWIVSLPRMMQSADDVAKHRRIYQISIAFKLLSEEGVDMGIILGTMAANLRDSVFNAIHDLKDSPTTSEYSSGVQSMELEYMSQHQHPSFGQILVSRKGQMEMLGEVSRFVEQLSQNSNSLDIVKDIIRGLYGTSGDLRLSNFWLSLNMLRYSPENTLSIDDLLDFDDGTPNKRQDLLEEMYDFSLGILTDISYSTNHDWRMQALALESVALQASQQKLDFRSELADVLYPVLHFIGSENPQLRNHAITCLDILAKESGHANTGEMVIANVDYLVNAVALRLNSFDISPQAPQVLLMMVKLSGPSLLPYLDDLVDSVFAALESFHGYPRLVDLLFSVLKAIVEEGVKSPLLAITNGDIELSQRKSPVIPVDMQEVTQAMKSVQSRQDSLTINENGSTSFPQRPWKSFDAAVKDGEETEDDEEEEKQEIEHGGQEVEAQPPAPRTYSLLLNISRLTQHYLVSSSSELRTSLLILLITAFPALAKHENSFLPLINTLWPVLLPRLSDSEAFVVAGALDVIRAMCVNAGDFMSSRISEAWPTIKSVYRTRTGKLGAQFSSSHSTMPSVTGVGAIVASSGRQLSLANGQQSYITAPSRIVWESIVQLLVSILDYVAVDDEMFEDIVDMLAPVVATRTDARKALESRNPDAVWLISWRSKVLEPHGTTTRSETAPRRTPQLPLPTRPQWQFAQLV